MAKIIIKRIGQISGSAVGYDAYLNNKLLGILRNGGILNFNADIGSHTLHFISRSKLNRKNSSFTVTVNNEKEVIEIITKIDYNGNLIVNYADNLPHVPNFNFADNKGIRCPSCVSNNLSTISETFTEGKDFNSSNACCGYLLCGPLGLLLGVDKKGKQQHTVNYWVCKKCGNKFRI